MTQATNGNDDRTSLTDGGVLEMHPEGVRPKSPSRVPEFRFGSTFSLELTSSETGELIIIDRCMRVETIITPSPFTPSWIEVSKGERLVLPPKNYALFRVAGPLGEHVLEAHVAHQPTSSLLVGLPRFVPLDGEQRVQLNDMLEKRCRRVASMAFIVGSQV